MKKADSKKPLHHICSTPRMASLTMPFDILDEPSTRSVKVMGYSEILLIFVSYSMD